VAGDGSAVKKERIKKWRLCNWASKGDISRVRQRTATHRRSLRGRTRTALALAVRVRYHVAGGVAFYERVGSICGMMMVCLVTAAAEKRVALPRVISHTIMSTEGKTRMHYGCATRPHPHLPPHPVNHVTGLVNSANDLRCYALRRPYNLSHSYSTFSCFIPLLSADYIIA
jgi:hypothetical protein